MRTTALRDIMHLAWQLVKKNGFAMAGALKKARKKIARYHKIESAWTSASLLNVK